MATTKTSDGKDWFMSNRKWYENPSKVSILGITPMNNGILDFTH